MKLNPDCIRDILLCVEKDATFTTEFRFNSDKPPKLLSKYKSEEIFYHARQAYQAQLVTNFFPFDFGNCFDIKDLSPAGHEFLANVRQDKVWKNVKSIAKSIGSISLNTLITIASNVISELISNQFGTNPSSTS